MLRENDKILCRGDDKNYFLEETKESTLEIFSGLVLRDA